jgi:flagellar biosynthesis protein FlhB
VANPISQVITAVASLIVLQIAFTIFYPMISGVFAGLVYDAIATGTGTMLDINSGSFILTVKIILMCIKLFAFFMIFAILARLFIYLGFLTEEEPAY